MATTKETKVRHRFRLLPWCTPEGKPCYLDSDSNSGPLAELADSLEATQLDNATEVLERTCELLATEGVSEREVRFTTQRLSECLRDVLRIVKSREGMREDELDQEDDEEGPKFPAEAFG
ncbi:hypothetical protein [Streptomyces sp. NPDC048172]|uniref:hypothetical protein n=1 Tax=Streptomyces sp. NPDC048172 TaxID=3365505 RepID=UPI00371A9142